MQKAIVDFVLIVVTSDFQHWSGICVMSAEIHEVSEVTSVILILETTAFYEKLLVINAPKYSRMDQVQFVEDSL